MNLLLQEIDVKICPEFINPHVYSFPSRTRQRRADLVVLLTHDNSDCFICQAHIFIVIKVQRRRFKGYSENMSPSHLKKRKRVLHSKWTCEKGEGMFLPPPPPFQNSWIRTLFRYIHNRNGMIYYVGFFSNHYAL